MLPIVILVWGFVFFQLFGSFFTSPNYAKEKENTIISIEEVKKDTFLIVADYRDPFLGNRAQSKKIGNSNNQARKISRKIAAKKSDKPWPSLAYNGMIKNNNSKRRVGIIKLNGKEYLIKEKDIVEDVTILNISKNFVKLRFQREIKTITK